MDKFSFSVCQLWRMTLVHMEIGNLGLLVVRVNRQSMGMNWGQKSLNGPLFEYNRNVLQGFFEV